MSETHTRGMVRRLQDIQDGLDALLTTQENEPEKLDALERLVGIGNAPDHDILAETSVLHEQGKAYFGRFERGGDNHHLERAITSWQRAVDLTPDTHPSMPSRLNSLGFALVARFGQGKSLADLDAAISLIRKAVDLTPDDDSDKPYFLSNFGNALEVRFSQQDSLADLDESIAQKRKAVNLTPDGHPRKALCLNHLGRALMKRFDRYGLPADLEHAIVQMRKAVKLTPDGNPDRPIFINDLGSALEDRFDRHGSPEDLEEAIKQKRTAVSLTRDGHPNKLVSLINLGNGLAKRFIRYGSLPDLEDAILHMQQAVNLTPDGHPAKPNRLHGLGNTLEMRFQRQGSLEDLEAAISLHRKAVNLTPEGHSHLSARLHSLGLALLAHFERRSSLADLEDASLQIQKAINLTPDDNPVKSLYLNSLGSISGTRFSQSGALPDLEGAILCRQSAIRLLPDGHPDLAICLKNLNYVLMIRYRRLGDQNDLQCALSAAREAAESPAASSNLQLQSAIAWAECCDLSSTSSLQAFEYAIRLLPRMAWLGLDVDDQYHLLADVGSTTPNAVAAAIAEDEYATALEWAEQGRSIVWQNLLGLRTPLEHLQTHYPQLAMRLRELSHGLEQSAEARSTWDELKPAGPARNRISLAIERDRLINEIRSKPDFEGFLKPKCLEDLAPAARDGAVVILNLGKTRCDALVLLSDDNGAPHVVAIPLERVTFQSTKRLSGKLVDTLSKTGVRARDSRKHRPQQASVDNGAIFREILKTLWLDYALPIMNGLAYEVNVDAPPRLWWCTTGPLAFLPLHAAGLYDSKDVGNKLSDYVISSYTPTLTALLGESSPVLSDDTKVLSVAISNTPGAPLPCTEEEVRNLQRLAAQAGLQTVSLRNEEATQERVRREMEISNWAHLSCHGEQVGGKPMESGLILHDGKLKLSEIVRARLPNAEFAFLSACQTAVGDGGVPEESAHLAAGMLFAGYRGVVATMWSIRDDIAPRVAEELYRHLFKHGQPKRTEAAYALHKAIRSLQEAEVPFTSWVPFIHIGR